MHKLLVQQIQRCLGSADAVPEALRPLLEVIDQAYHQADDDRRMLERSLDISSAELLERYEKLTREVAERRRFEEELRRTQEELERRVAERTAALSRANDELAKSRDEALDLARAKADFMANMSHELRTPLNAVIGMTGLLHDTDLDARQRDYAETARQAAESLLALVNDVLDFSKMEAGKLTLEEVSFDPREVVDEAVQLVASSARAKGLSLVVRCSPAVPDSVQGDPGRLRQVMLNLLSNAVKFTAKGGISVGVDVEPAGLRFEVRDTGTGIPSETLPRLFQSFSQADSSMSRRYGGTGLGLAICRRLVEMMGGTIGVSSESGRGASFVFSVRCRTLAVEPAETPLKGCRVRVVAADAQAQAAHAEVLARAGAEILPAEGAGAPPQAVVIDLPEPLRTDYAAGLPPGIPVVSLVATDVRAGASGVLVKPPRRAALVGAVRSALRGPAAAAAPAGGAPSPRPASGARLRILIVEDNPVNQRVALSMILSLGHSADTVSSGREAIEAFDRIPYDVILMDCQMPEMDGYDASRAIRAREDGKRRIPIIAMTANVLDGDRQRCLDAGMDDYLPKPVKIGLLEQQLGRWAPGARRDPS